MKRYFKILILIFIAALSLIGCEGSNEVYVPETTRLTDSVYTVSDTTPTFTITKEDPVKQLVVDLSCIKNAPEPTDVTIRIKMKDSEVVSYSVTTARSVQEPTRDVPPSPAHYIIKDGDTPTGLAKKFNVPVAKIKTPLLKGKKLMILE